MKYFKASLERENNSVVYPFDIKKGFDYIYDNEYKIVYFISEEEINGAIEINKEEYELFFKEEKNVNETKPSEIEEKPSEIEELKNRVISLEEVLMFVLSGGE